MKTMMPTVEWPHRPSVGKFCMFNCFQEALSPILERDFGIGADTFERLRFIGLPDIADPMIGRRDPGGFGGLAWPRLRELYRLRLRWLRRVARDEPEAVHALAQHGPLIAIVDRFHMPTDKVCFGTNHRMHTILVVQANEDGIGYTDVEYPFHPAQVSWEEFGRALLPNADRILQPGPDQVNSFVMRVEECTEPGPAVRDRLRRDFLTAFANSLDADAARIQEVRELLMDGLSEFQRDGDRLRGNDLGSLLNGAVRSLQLAAALLESEDEVGTQVSELGQQAESANRLLQMYVESGRDRYLARIDRDVRRLAECWGAVDRDAVQGAVERSALPPASHLSNREGVP